MRNEITRIFGDGDFRFKDTNFKYEFHELDKDLHWRKLYLFVKFVLKIRVFKIIYSCNQNQI
jgi:hypothetical protein